MSSELAVGTAVPIFTGKGDITNCSCCRAVKLLEHGMKTVWVLTMRLHKIVTVNEMCFGFMLDRGTFGVELFLSRLQGQYSREG